jgi:hypothetical protein
LSLDDPAVRAWTLGFVLLPTVRDRLELYFGPSKHLAVLKSFIQHSKLSLAELAEEMKAGERSIRCSNGSGGSRTGWLRGIVEYYLDRGLLKTVRRGSRIYYSLNDASADGLFLKVLYPSLLMGSQKE